MAVAGSSKFRPLQTLLDASSSVRRISKLPRRNVVEIAGPDAKKFVKGLFCNDVDDIGGGYSGFLNASGRVIHGTFVVPVPSAVPTYLITHNPSSTSQPLAKLLASFKLRSKVKIRDVTEQYDVHQAWGPVDAGAEPERTWKFGSGGAAEATWSWSGGYEPPSAEDGETGCWDLRAGYRGGMGRHIITPKGKPPSLTRSHELSSEEDYHLQRMLLGVPEDQTEIHAGISLPLESCMDIQGGVDFRKGCYLGQELTVRTYHTGATRKRILPIALIPTTQGHHGTPLHELIGTNSDLKHAENSSGGEITYYPPPDAPSQKPRPAGKILSQHPSVGHIGLGLVRLEFAERSWWNTDITTLGQWLQGGKLLTNVNGQDLGVYVDKGEAYAAALDSLEAKVIAEEA